MSSINQQALANPLQLSDQLVVWSSGNGDTRRTSLTALLALLQSAWEYPASTGSAVGPTYLPFVGGTNAIIASAAVGVDVPAFAAGDRFSLFPTGDNSGATTITIGTLPVKDVFMFGAACTGGELKAGVPVEIMYDGVQFQIMGDGAAVTRGGAAALTNKSYAGSTLALTGAATVGGTLGVTGDVTTAGAINAATVAGAVVATQAQQEAGASVANVVTSGRQQFHPSAFKFWIKCDASGSIKASYNIASITDAGTGLVNLTYTTAFSSADYFAGGSAADTSGGVRNVKTTAYAAGTSNWACYGETPALADPNIAWNLSGAGDQP